MMPLMIAVIFWNILAVTLMRQDWLLNQKNSMNLFNDSKNMRKTGLLKICLFLN